MKRTLALIPAVLLLAGTLTSCTSDEKSVADGCVEPGSLSDSVKVEGGFGEQLKLDVDKPIKADKVERTVLETDQRGKSDAIGEDENVFTSLTVFDGTDGSVTEFTQTMLTATGSYSPWVKQTLNCAKGGERVVIVTPKQDVVGKDKAKADETLVIVSDLYVPELEKAEGEDVKLPADLPEVSVAKNGEPTITIPDSAKAPETLTVETMVKGKGDEIKPGDTVFVHYRGVIMRTGEEFDSSWSRGEFSHFNAATDEEAAEVGAKLPVIRGFRDALVGQTVGSRVMSIVPAEDGGYGGDRLKSMGHEEDDVMVFVLDILGSMPATVQ